MSAGDAARVQRRSMPSIVPSIESIGFRFQVSGFRWPRIVCDRREKFQQIWQRLDALDGIRSGGGADQDRAESGGAGPEDVDLVDVADVGAGGGEEMETLGRGEKNPRVRFLDTHVGRVQDDLQVRREARVFQEFPDAPVGVGDYAQTVSSLPQDGESLPRLRCGAGPQVCPVML